MTTYYKAVRPDGTSFWDPEFRWVPQSGPVGGFVVEHPDPHDHVGAEGYLSVATVATDCTGMKWPCRLLEVESVEGREVHTPDRDSLPNKRASAAWRVVRELPAHLALGPQGEHVSALLARVQGLVLDELRRLASRDAARDAARDVAIDAARDAAGDAVRVAAWVAAWDTAWHTARDAAKAAAWVAAWDATWVAAWDAAWVASRDAARALLVRDLLAREHYDALTRHWRETIGPIHPDDMAVADDWEDIEEDTE